MQTDLFSKPSCINFCVCFLDLTCMRERDQSGFGSPRSVLLFFKFVRSRLGLFQEFGHPAGETGEIQTVKVPVRVDSGSCAS